MAIVDEFEAMIEAGAGLVVATVCPDGTPRAGRAWSAVVVGPDVIRVVMSADDPQTVANLETGRVSVTAADVTSLRSVQIKGRARVVEAPSEQDLAEMERQTTRFFEVVHVIDGNPLAQLQRMRPSTVVAIELSVEGQFDQSPGPSAGAVIGAQR